MATTVESGGVARILQSGIERQSARLDPLAERLQKAVNSVLEQGGPTARQVKDFLNGTWLGHSLHPVLTDVPVGAWVTSAVLDLTGPAAGADAALALGILASLPTAASGVADWQDQAGKQRRTGLAHAMFNGAALACYIGSWMARKSDNRSLGVGLSTTGFALMLGGAYLGGELVYAQGTNVDRNAWDPEVEGWKVAARLDDLPDGQLARGEISVDGQKLPLVLLRRGGDVLALGNTCSHMGGPLHEGKLEGENCVVCPWHGSTFDMRDGSVVHGPSAYPQPDYETRVIAGNVQVRPKA